jgi:hypothetical protein
LEDHELRARSGKAGEAAVRERFTADVMARETFTVLREFVNETAGDPHSPS